MPAFVVPDVATTPITLSGFGSFAIACFEARAREAMVVGRHDERLDAEHVQCLADARVGVARRWRSAPRAAKVGPLGTTHVASDSETREVAERAARDEGAAGPLGHAGQVREELEGQILGDDDAARLQPAGAVETGAGDHHVEEQ